MTWGSSVHPRQETFRRFRLTGALYLTKNVGLYSGNNPFNCYTVDFHGAATSLHGNGNQPVQTWAWPSYMLPGFYVPHNGSNRALHDISIPSHEISEWADDPFLNNYVEPCSTATAPFYGCSNNLETGDPVVSIGFAMGTNISFQPVTGRSTAGYRV